MEWARYDVGRQPHELGDRSIEPFAWAPQGKRHRVAWASGAVVVGASSPPVVWENLFAVSLEEAGLTVVRADSNRVARLTFKGFVPGWYPGHNELEPKLLRVHGPHFTYVLPLVELEALLEGKSRDVALTIQTEWSRCRPDARLACVVLWKLSSTQTLVEVGDGRGGNHRPKLTIELAKVFAKHTPIVLVDELTPGVFQRAEIAGEVVELLPPPESVQTVTLKLKHTVADHPDGTDRPAITRAEPAARNRLAALLDAIRDEPDVVANREVLIDLLQELEDPAAQAFAALRAGNALAPAKKKAALGPLAPFILEYEALGGLPIAATLSRSARLADVTEDACADWRLGLLRTLRIGLANRRINTLVITAPAATQLRDVDVTHATTADALIAADRRELTRIGHIDLTKPRLLARLAHPTFDRVTTFHVAMEANPYVRDIIEQIVMTDHKGVFSRVPRTLEIEVVGHKVELEDFVARLDLPCRVVIISAADER